MKKTDYEQLSAERRLTHRDKMKLYFRRYRTLNNKRINETARRSRLAAKANAFDAYGGRKCCWCGEDDTRVLTIDHIDNNGSKHIDNKGHRMTGNRMSNWLKKNNYPDGFQVLCMNCNTAKAQNNGTLPGSRKNKRCLVSRCCR